MTEQKVKDAVRARDGYRCVECGMTQRQHLAERGRQLEVHRLVPGAPYSVEGTVTLCKPCHAKKKPRSGIKKRSIRLPRELLDMASAVAPMMGQRPAAYIENALRVALSFAP